MEVPWIGGIAFGSRDMIEFQLNIFILQLENQAIHDHLPQCNHGSSPSARKVGLPVSEGQALRLLLPTPTSLEFLTPTPSPPLLHHLRT